MGARPEQWNALMDILAHDLELLHGDFKGPLGVVRTRQRWEEIAVIVNQIAGHNKDGAGWKEAWNGLKNRARDACRKRAAYMYGTGGGPVAEIAGLGLSALHERVLNLTGLRAAFGSSAPNPLQIQIDLAAQALNAEGEGDMDAPEPGLNAGGEADVGDPEPAPPEPAPQGGAVIIDEEPEAPQGEDAVVAAAHQELAVLEEPHLAVLVVDDEKPAAEVAEAKVLHLATIDVDGEILMPFAWDQRKASDDIIVMDLVTPPKDAVKHEPLVTLKEEPGLHHTPPRGSGMTPSCKRRLLSGHDNTSDEGSSVQPGTSSVTSYEAVIHQNTIIMQEMLKVMQSLCMKLGL